MKESYFLIEPKDRVGCMSFLTEIEWIVDELGSYQVKALSLISLFKPLKLKKEFEETYFEEEIKPSNYILVRASNYRNILKAKLFVEDNICECNLFNLSKYNCDVNKFLENGSCDFCEVTVVADLLYAKCMNEDNFEEVSFDYLEGFEDSFGNKVEVFRAKSKIFYFAKNENLNKVYNFVVEEPVIRTFLEEEDDDYIKNFFNDYINEESIGKKLIKSEVVSIATQDIKFWDDIVENMIHNPSSVKAGIGYREE